MPRSCRAPSHARCVCNGRARTNTAGTPKVRRNCSMSPARSSSDGRILDWRTEMWIPAGNAGIAQHSAAGAGSRRARSRAGSQRRPHFAERRSALCGGEHSGHRPLAEEHAAASGTDPLARQARQLPSRSRASSTSWRQRRASIRSSSACAGSRIRAGSRSSSAWRRSMKWQSRPSPGRETHAAIARGRGMAYVHYKHNEAYVAIGMEVAVEPVQRAGSRSSAITCAHDCGQIINPDGVRAQVEGSILQTLSRVLMEEVKFDRARRHQRRLVELSDPAVLRCARPPHRPDRPAERAARSEPARRPALRSAPHSPTPCSMPSACACARVPFTPARVKAAISGQPS